MLSKYYELEALVKSLEGNPDAVVEHHLRTQELARVKSKLSRLELWKVENGVK